ncbi:hypothetical protein SB759_31905, partial [Pseudomonas sp. SIMBA_059]
MTNPELLRQSVAAMQLYTLRGDEFCAAHDLCLATRDLGAALVHWGIASQYSQAPMQASARLHGFDS